MLRSPGCARSLTSGPAVSPDLRPMPDRPADDDHVADLPVDFATFARAVGYTGPLHTHLDTTNPADPTVPEHHLKRRALDRTDRTDA